MRKWSVSRTGLGVTTAIGLMCCLAPFGEAAVDPDSLAICDSQHAEGKLLESEATAREILVREPHSYAALWRLSRCFISAGNLANEEKESRRCFEEAQNLARRAVALNPEGTHGFTCLAVCAGNLSNFGSGREKIIMAEDARGAARTAIALDQDNDLAYLVLGVWNREIATVGGLTKLAAKIIYGGVPEGASLEESERCLRRAVALAPERLNHRRELAITLMAMNRSEEALEQLEMAVDLDRRQPEDEIYAASAQILLDEILEDLDGDQNKHW